MAQRDRVYLLPGTTGVDYGTNSPRWDCADRTHRHRECRGYGTQYPVKAPPPPAPVYDWTGFYLGGFYGNSLSQSQASTPAPGLPVGTHSGAVDINSIG